MILIVTGSRHWTSYDIIKRELLHLYRKSALDFVIEGGAEGADKIARQVAEELGVTPVTVHALWKFHHKAAGPIRNRALLKLIQPYAEDKCGVNVTLLAFHENINESKGTKDMIKQAQRLGILTRLIDK